MVWLDIYTTPIPTFIFWIDKILLAIVPLDTELIPPDATSNFSLIYPNYTEQILRYSVGFKLRNGELVPYKDMRGPR